MSDFVLPTLILLILLYALKQKVPIYDTFVAGARNGLKTVLGIVPTLVGLMAAVGMLRASGFLDLISIWLGKGISHLGFPAELVPLSIVRMFSSSAATGLVLDLFKEYGTDSRIGKIASIMMSCTETIFYTMSVYLIAAKVKKSRYILQGALLATITGIIMSVWLARWM